MTINNDNATQSNNLTLSQARPGERGSVMVVALMCLVVLFALTIAATKIRVASARDIEDKTAQATQYWDARSGASTVEASLTTDIPSIFDAEMLRAQTAVGGYPLPAFDPPQISSNYSRPVLNPDGTITSSNASQCTSLLGNLNAWAQRKTSIAETYAAERGYGPDKARVAVFQEALRQQLIGADPNSEPAYLLEYQIDAAVGQQGNARGRVRPSGKIMLGPAQPGCNTTASLTANPTDIALGSFSTLTVTYTSASHVWLTDQTGATVPGTDTTGLPETPDAQTLTFDVSPIDNTSYRAHAEGSGCRAVSGEVTIIVNYPPPEIIQFTANPSCINRGQSATLSFQVRYASSINITGGGINQTFPGNTGTTVTSGTFVVSPTSDTTYTLTATGRGGSATRNTSVTVKQPFSIDQFTSNTYCVIPGNPVNLTWANTNAETATITDSTSGASVNVTPSGGTRSFTVNSTTTYTLSITRTGCSGVETLTRQLTVNTSPGPTATFAANPSDMELGNATTLQWTTTNASTVTITPSPVAGSGMSGPQTVSSSGSLTITPSAINQSPGYTYTLTVTSGGCSPQTITKTTVVIVRPVFVPPPCPNVISFTADSCVASGGNSVLQWNVADSDSITITGPGVNRTFSGNPVGTGSLIVNPTADSTYTLTATRAGSCTPASPPFPTSATVSVRISQAPSVNNFLASPAVIDAGQTSQLSWSESPNLSSVRIAGTGGDTNTYTIAPGQQFLDVRPTATTTYTITVTSNDCAAQASSKSLTVTVANCPTISSFTASPATIINGGSSTLQWTTLNATQVLLNGVTPVATNGSTVVSPNATTTYRLTAVSSNGTCNIDQFVTVTVNPCPAPQILSFTATPNSVTIGGSQMIRLAWSINDASGTGLTITIPGIGTFNNPNSFVDISQPQSTTTYTLQVTNGCGTPNSAQIQVIASACPQPSISSFTANPSTVTEGGNQTVRLSWTISDPSGTGLTVNIPGVGTFATTTGFTDITQPAATTTYTLTATNGCGASDSKTATVTVQPSTGCPPPPPGQPVANSYYTISGTACCVGPGVSGDNKLQLRTRLNPDSSIRIDLLIRTNDRPEGGVQRSKITYADGNFGNGYRWSINAPTSTVLTITNPEGTAIASIPVSTSQSRPYQVMWLASGTFSAPGFVVTTAQMDARLQTNTYAYAFGCGPNCVNYFNLPVTAAAAAPSAYSCGATNLQPIFANYCAYIYDHQNASFANMSSAQDYETVQLLCDFELGRCIGEMNSSAQSTDGAPAPNMPLIIQPQLNLFDYYYGATNDGCQQRHLEGGSPNSWTSAMVDELGRGPTSLEFRTYFPGPCTGTNWGLTVLFQRDFGPNMTAYPTITAYRYDNKHADFSNGGTGAVGFDIESYSSSCR